MVNLPVDESYAFDFLSILEIKTQYNDSVSLQNHIRRCVDALSMQIGKARVDEILSSEEYTRLKDANKNTFRLVDLAKHDKVLASDVDYSNLVRFNFRRALQNKFFTEKTAEVKIGYDQAYKGR